MAASTKQDSEPWVTATPRVCLHDVPTALKAGGLAPHFPVTLSASLTDENGKQFVSHAHYRTDEHGNLDVQRAAAVGGSYTGVFPMGLLTTLAPAPHEFPFLRLYSRDPRTPWKVTVRLSDGHQPLEEKAESLAEVELKRHLMAPGVRRLPVREGRVRGTLYLPPGDGPFPGVIDMFGSIGGLMEFRAAMMASRGIATLALAFFAYEDLPKTMDDLELEYFEEAVETLLRQAEVVPDRCGVVATSKSSDVACCMATWMPQVKAIVCIGGSPFIYDLALTHRGQMRVEGVKLDMSCMVIDGGRLHPRQEVITQKLTADPRNFVPIEQADDDTFFLMAAGTDDTFSMSILQRLAQERMDSKGRSAWVKTVEYPGAGHILEPPYGAHVYHSYHRHTPMMSEDGTGRVMGVTILWGGNARDTCHAQEDLWARTLTFFTKHVRDNSAWYKQHCNQTSNL